MPLTEEEVLREHVYHSNAIEGIASDPHSPHFYSHLHATRCVALGFLIHPNYIHNLVGHCVPELCLHKGVLRTTNVTVGARPMPHYSHVPKLMNDWVRLVAEYQNTRQEKTEGDVARAANLIHDIFLCIHPYKDGNGRTARLIKNMLRAHKGLPWSIDYFENRAWYYQGIAYTEDRLFKKKYPDVYQE